MHSRNCLREARAAMAGDKPLVLVHEADPQKGGLPVIDDTRAIGSHWDCGDHTPDTM